MKPKTLINDFTQGSISRQLIVFSLPFVLGNALQSLYTLVDMAIVGQYVGSSGLSAISISGMITMLVYAVGMGTGDGGQILISQQVGAKDYDGLKSTIGTLISGSILISFVMVAVTAVFTVPLLNLMNTPGEAFYDAKMYMYFCCIGFPFTFGYGSFSAVLRAMGDSKRPMIFIAVSCLTNVVLDLLFVAVWNMGAAGAALATSISQFVSFAAAAGFLYKNRDVFGFDFTLKSFAIKKDKLLMIGKLSLPLVCMSFAISVSMMVVNAYVNAYGVVASAVAGVGGKLYSLMNVVTGALQAAVASFVGQNMGAGRKDRAEKCVWVALWICLGFFVIIGVLCWVFPRQIFAVFSSDPAVLDMSVTYMHIAFWLYLSFALMAPFLGHINGIGFPSLNFVVAILDGVVARIGLSLLLGVTLGMGLEGFWWGNAISAYISVIIPGIYFISGKWKNRRSLVENQA